MTTNEVGTSDVEAFLAHHGVKGQKWGVRKAPTSTSSSGSGGKSTFESDAIRLAKGTKAGNVANVAISVASVAAVAASAPVSAPLLVGGVVSSRVAIKSIEAYKMFYAKHPPKSLPKASAEAMAKFSVGRDLRKQMVHKYGAVKVSALKKTKQAAKAAAGGVAGNADSFLLMS